MEENPRNRRTRQRQIETVEVELPVAPSAAEIIEHYAEAMEIIRPLEEKFADFCDLLERERTGEQ
jgi:hypothetical protein